MFHAKLDSIVEPVPSTQYILCILGDFDAVTGTENDCYVICVGPHGSCTKNINISLLLSFTRPRWLRGLLVPGLREVRLTAGVTKEIDHILASIC